MAMNKRHSILFILGIAATAFTGCAGDDELSGSSLPGTGSDGTAVVIANSDEEIRLGSGGNSGLLTRAFIEGDEAGNFETKDGIGVFCLADHLIADANTLDEKAREISWNQHRTGRTVGENGVETVTSEGYTYGRYMNWMGPSATETWGGNVKANAKIEDDVTRIVWGDGITRFYPMSNMYAYKFYGYHPYQESVTDSPDAVEVEIPITGITDVLWGCTESQSDNLAYSAKYFRSYRETNGTEAPTPSIAFKHLLSRIDFKVKKASGSTDNGKMYIEDLVLLGKFNKNLILTVANKDHTKDGSVVAKDDKQYIQAPVKFPGIDGEKSRNGVKLLADVAEDGTESTLLDMNGGTGVEITSDEKDLGYGIIVPPTDVSETTYGVMLQIRYVYKDENDEEHTQTFTPDFPAPFKFEGGLLAGHRYTVTVSVSSPEMISLNATLSDWTSDDSDSTEIEF